MMARLVFACCIGISMQAQVFGTKEVKKIPWWQNAIIYEIYVRSFADSNDDGIGDLRGVIDKLDYLDDLGVDAIWLTPFYPSPQVDLGYDISDYMNVDPLFGELSDFDELVQQAHKRGIRIIIDFVLNHTSDQHPWFVASRSSKDNPFREWYIWHDGKAGGPPNNWNSIFGGSAWEYDKNTDQWYYHFFFKEQPDLNWRNPAVKKAMFDVIDFWFDRDIDGLRLDAFIDLFEDEQLRDNPEGNLRPDGTREQATIYNANLPEVHDILREMNAHIRKKKPDALLIGETESDQFTINNGKHEERIAVISSYFGNDYDELHLPMNLFFPFVNELNAERFRKEIDVWINNPKKGCPIWLFDNHDTPRSLDRYGDGKHDEYIAKLLAALLLTLPGTVQLYYGQEIGMKNNDPQTFKEIYDPICKLFWPNVTFCRDGCRTPMQWNDKPFAGFSMHTPWIKVHPNFKTTNVAHQEQDPHSILQWYKQLIHLKKTEPALKYGIYKPVLTDHPAVLSYLRKDAQQTYVVVLNMSDKWQTTSFDLKPYAHKANVILASNENEKVIDLCMITLAPYGVIIAVLSA